MGKKDAAIQEDVAQTETAEQENVVENTEEDTGNTETEDALENDEEQQEPVRSARDIMMDDMVKKRREEARGEIDESTRVYGEEAREEDETEQPADEPQMVDLKVDGQIIQKPKSEVDAEGGVAEMQKKIAVETRMSQAAEERRRLEHMQHQQRQREQELTQREQELNARAQRMQQLADDPNSDVTDEDATIAQQFVDGFYSGDEDQAKDVFAKVVKELRSKSQPSQAQPDPEQFAAQVQERIEYRSSLNEGKSVFDSNYAHLKQDPQLFRMTDEATARLAQKHPEWAPKQIILEAAKEVDGWLHGLSGASQNRQGAPSGTQNLVSEQQQRKQNMDRIPTATSRKPTQPTTKPKTPRDIFNDIRKNRAQG